MQFNTNAYSEASQFTFGDAARNYIGITAPPNLMEDFDAMKTFHIGETVKAVFRMDYFNAFNRTQFGAGGPPPVDNCIDCGGFGLVPCPRFTHQQPPGPGDAPRYVLADYRHA